MAAADPVAVLPPTWVDLARCLRLRKPTPDDCVERRTLNWLKLLDQLGAAAIRDGEPELAARIYLTLFQLSWVNRRRIDKRAGGDAIAT